MYVLKKIEKYDKKRIEIINVTVETNLISRTEGGNGGVFLSVSPYFTVGPVHFQKLHDNIIKYFISELTFPVAYEYPHWEMLLE